MPAPDHSTLRLSLPAPVDGVAGLAAAIAVPARQAQAEPRGRSARIGAVIALATTLAACAQQVPSAVEPAAPGFLLGLWHGFIFPVAWVLSLFVDGIAIYAVPNNGGWYDFGYFVGIVFLGVGARSSRTVYRTRIIERPAQRGTVIDHEP